MKTAGAISVIVAVGCVGRPANLGAIESEGASAGGSEEGGSESSSSGAPDDTQTSGDETTGGGVAPACNDVGEGALRRLDDQQYANTIRDLFGIEYAFPGLDGGDPFPTAWSNDPAEEYAAAAGEVATLVDIAALASCSLDATGAEADACVEQFIDDVGPRAFRHALTDDERDALLGVADNEAPTLEASLRNVLAAMLAHPSFTRPTAIGSPAPEGAPLLELDAWSLATRLSYFIWNSTPDEALFAAAESGALLEQSELVAQAERLLADPRAGVMQGDFYDYLLDTKRLPEVSKHESFIPPWSVELGEAMVVEQRRFVGDVSSLDDLLAATHTFANADIAAIYGDDLQGAAPGGVAFERVELSEHRKGVLTRLAFLSSNAAGWDVAVPSLRGKALLDAFYCMNVPPPPPDVQPGPFEEPPEGSFREMWEQAHIANAACSACHVIIDGPGWAFANYDPLGRWVDEIDGYPVDASGDMPAFEPLVEFEDLDGLIELMRADERVSACVAQRYFEFAVRRGLDERDACTLDELATEFAAAEGNFHALMLAIVQSRAFRLARP